LQQSPANNAAAGDRSSSNCSDNATTSSVTSAVKSNSIKVVSNPLHHPQSESSPISPWDPGSRQPVVFDHTYQTIGDVFQPLQQPQQPLHQEPIYHTLEPSSEVVMSGGQQFDTLGRLDVMLPNGQFVPATLVRQKGGAGGIVPLVEIGSNGQHQAPIMSPFAGNKLRTSSKKSASSARDKRNFV
jgi:hypothetical protein